MTKEKSITGGEVDQPTMYARDLDGTGSLHACSKGDPGAIPLYHSTRGQTVDVEELKAELRQYFNAYCPGIAEMLHRHGDALLDYITANGMKIVKVGE